MLRAVVRPLATAVAAAGAVSGAPTQATAEAASATQLPRNLRLFKGTVDSKHHAGEEARTIELCDGWDLVERSEESKAGGLSFGSIPAREEVEQATRELFETYQREVVVHEPESQYTSDHEEEGSEEGYHSESDCEFSSASVISDPQESQIPFARSRGLESLIYVEHEQQAPVATRGSQVLVSSSVDHMFELMQKDPEVREVVHSLALDPALWEAFNKNEAVQRLIRNRHAAERRLEGLDDMDPRGAGIPSQGPGAAAVFSGVAYFFQQVLGAVNDMVRKIFGLAESSLPAAAKSENAADATLKGCMAVAILVLSAIVLKRFAR